MKLSEKLEVGRVLTGLYGTAPGELYGAFEMRGPCGVALTIIASPGDDEIDIPWEHVSVSLPNRTPNWVEMCFVKDLFWDEEETVMQLHPPRSKWVNNHQYCLHLWRPTNAEIPLPPEIAVGVKEKGILDHRRPMPRLARPTTIAAMALLAGTRR